MAGRRSCEGGESHCIGLVWFSLYLEGDGWFYVWCVKDCRVYHKIVLHMIVYMYDDMINKTSKKKRYLKIKTLITLFFN